MYSFEIVFYPDLTKNSHDEFFDGRLSDYLAALNRNGNLCGRDWNLIERGKEVVLYCMAPAADAFQESLMPPATREAYAEMLALSDRAPEVKCLGPTVGGDDFCSCERWTSLILFTHFIRASSPVSCGDCGRPVARYTLTNGREEGDAGLRCWEGVYQACDTLHMESGVGEQFGYSQISQSSSELSKQGRSVARHWSEKTGVPIYYYLHRYEDVPLEKCPDCGGDWRTEDRRRYRRWCDRCLLVLGDENSSVEGWLH